LPGAWFFAHADLGPEKGMEKKDSPPTGARCGFFLILHKAKKRGSCFFRFLPPTNPPGGGGGGGNKKPFWPGGETFPFPPKICPGRKIAGTPRVGGRGGKGVWERNFFHVEVFLKPYFFSKDNLRGGSKGSPFCFRISKAKQKTWPPPGYFFSEGTRHKR